MKEFLAAMKALGDSNRLRALLSLRTGELCLCRIIELLGLAPSTVSKHMSILKQAGLVESRKEERWIYYRLPENSEDHAISRLIKITVETLGSDQTIETDAGKLAKILKISPETLCKKNRNSAIRT